MYGPLFIKEFWVPPRIRIFIKTEFSAWSVNKQRWTKDTRDNVNQYGARFLSWILPLFFTIILLENGQLLLAIKSFRIRRVPDLLVSSLAVIVFIYQLFWTQAWPEGMCTNGTHRSLPRCQSLPNPTTRKGWPHHRGLRPLLFSNSDVGSFTSHKNKSVKVLWDGTYSFSSLSEKTRKSNHLQMSLQRQHFLLSYLKTLSVGPAGVWTRDLPLGRPVLSQLS